MREESSVSAGWKGAVSCGMECVCTCAYWSGIQRHHTGPLASHLSLAAATAPQRHLEILFQLRV